MGYISKNVKEETDKKIKKLKADIEKEGRRISEASLIDELAEERAEKRGIELEPEEPEDDFMDIFK